MHVTHLVPQAKLADVLLHFDVTAVVKPVVAFVPMGPDNQNKQFAFVYLKSLADFRSALGQDRSFICCREVRVALGVYAGGRGAQLKVVLEGFSFS